MAGAFRIRALWRVALGVARVVELLLRFFRLGHRESSLSFQSAFLVFSDVRARILHPFNGVGIEVAALAEVDGSRRTSRVGFPLVPLGLALTFAVGLRLFLRQTTSGRRVRLRLEPEAGRLRRGAGNGGRHAGDDAHEKEELDHVT